MLEILEQKFNKDGNIIFKRWNSPEYDRSDSKTIKGVITSLEANFPSLLSIISYTKAFIEANIELRNIVNLENKLNLSGLIKALKTNTHLIELYLSGYDITAEQATELGEALATHPSLEKLCFYNCGLTRKGAQLIAQGIERNKQLHFLSLNNSILANGGIHEIDNALKNNHSITTCELLNVKDFDPNDPTSNTPAEQHVPSASKQSIESSVTRNKNFFEQRTALEEKFLLFEALKIIPPDPKREQYNLRFKRHLSKKEQGQLSTKITNAKQEINQKASEEKNSVIASLFEEMMAIIDTLRQQGFNGHLDLLHRVNCAKADFYLNTDKTKFYKLYGDYFIQHPDPSIDFKFAEKIYTLEDPSCDVLHHPENKKMLTLLGLYENHLRYQYFIKRLEDNKDRKAINLCGSYHAKLARLTSKSIHTSSSKTSSKSTQKAKSPKTEENTSVESKKQTTENPEVTNANLEIEKKVCLKYTLAQNLRLGPYERIFNETLLSKMIEWGHSRIVSAERLDTLSSNLTYDQMQMILQIEYAALPDDDKKTSYSFFTAYRHRTLEKALEAVFVKENIPPAIQIDKNENLFLAFTILQWIGDQERSFSYKKSKPYIVFSTMQELGKIAHKMVVSNEEELFNLKQKALTALHRMSPTYDVTSLTEKLKPSNPTKNQSNYSK